ncbi:rCG44867 [Rattus norvegicus]|uniref:RCG44867 n=1 Tax=Rattus norvegicus TaxID=10116 RepID=A6I4W0_RAT|nr:rCG44867 [Rattus norvegicus]
MCNTQGVASLSFFLSMRATLSCFLRAAGVI